MFERYYERLNENIEKIEYNENFEFVESVENIEIILECENIIIKIIGVILRKNNIIFSNSMIKNYFKNFIEFYIRNDFENYEYFNLNLLYNFDLYITNSEKLFKLIYNNEYKSINENFIIE